MGGPNGSISHVIFKRHYITGGEVTSHSRGCGGLGLVERQMPFFLGVTLLHFGEICESMFPKTWVLEDHDRGIIKHKSIEGRKKTNMHLGKPQLKTGHRAITINLI
jgi:hypothetical protein